MGQADRPSVSGREGFFLWESYCVVSVSGKLPGLDNKLLTGWMWQRKTNSHLQSETDKQLDTFYFPKLHANRTEESGKQKNNNYRTQTPLREAKDRHAETHEGLIGPFRDGVTHCECTVGTCDSDVWMCSWWKTSMKTFQIHNLVHWSKWNW